jgi:hypothetical protein
MGLGLMRAVQGLGGGCCRIVSFFVSQVRGNEGELTSLCAKTRFLSTPPLVR